MPSSRRSSLRGSSTSDEKPQRPVTRSKTPNIFKYQQSKLSSDKIAECLEFSDSGDEFDNEAEKKPVGKTRKGAEPASEDTSSTMTRSLKGLKKTNEPKHESNQSTRPRRSCAINQNLNEETLWNKSILQKSDVESSTKAKKRTKPLVNKDESNDVEKSDISEADENNMDSANQASPSKRKKPADVSQMTPIKAISLKTSPSKTPCTRMNSLSLNSPRTPMGRQMPVSPWPSSAKRSLVKDLSQDLDKKSNVSTTKNGVDNKKPRVAKYNDWNLHRDKEENAESESGDDSDKSFNPDNEDESSDSDQEESDDNDDEDYIQNNYKRPKTPSKNHLKTPSKSTRTPKIGKASLQTPTKLLSRLSIHTLTPSVCSRVSNVAKPATPLQSSRQRLHVSFIPKSLPCREELFNQIYVFLSSKLSDNTGGCIYISGVPGTGKTATVNEVIRVLRRSVDKGEVPDFQFVDINGMKMSEPRQAYVQIWKKLTGESRTWEDAQKRLHEKFTKANSKKGMTLLLVDELDLLCTKRQDVIYNLLDWPSKKNAQLVVVTIANTMDLPERMLMGKVTSRLGLTRLTFQPYTFKQLEEIVLSRLKNQDAFDNDTIQLVARKVAAVSGDARRALDICRRSTEVAEANKREMVTMIDVKQALDEMIASPKIQAIKHCSVLEKYFLQAVCAEVERTGLEEVVFRNVYLQLKAMASIMNSGLKPPNVTQALFMCSRLGSYRLLYTEHSRQDIYQRIMLNISVDDVYFATKEIET